MCTRSWCMLLLLVVCMSSSMILSINGLVPIDGQYPLGDHKRHFNELDVGDLIDDIPRENFSGNETTPTAPMDALTSDQASIVTSSNGIIYHGGKLLSNAPIVYIIFYGNFAGSTTPQILIDAFSNQQGAKYWTTLATYWTQVSNQYFFINQGPKWGGVAYDTSYSLGTSITDTNVFDIVKKAIFAKKVPLNSNAVYFVVTSADVAATSGMCTKYCGWHTSNKLGTSPIRFSYIGSPLRCPNACSKSSTTNNNREADGMVNIIMHELVEAMSDPDINAWYDGSYYENADKCAWKFGTTYTAPNGAPANMQFGNRHFLVQQTWVNAKGGYCAISYP